MRRFLSVLLVLWAVPAWAGSYNCANPSACTVTCNGTNDHEALNSAIAAATAGSTITIQSGACSFSGQVALSKYVKIAGAGGGGYVGRSESTVTTGTGSKTFAWSVARPDLMPTVGETLTARYINGGGVEYMTGTVTSFNGTTLVMNMTSSAGTAQHKAWAFERAASTTITNNYTTVTADTLILITESTAGNIEISGVKLDTGTAAGGWHVRVAETSGGKPVLIHDTWMSMHATGGVEYLVNRGVVYRNSFNGYLCANGSVPTCTSSIEGAVYTQPQSVTSWATASTIGTADTDGTHNLYVEDNYLLVFWQAAAGPEDGGRIVIRNNVFDNTPLGWHGADSDYIGARHFEVYDNTFIQSDIDSAADPPVAGYPYNINQWVLLRGGTGVITGNAMENLSSGWYGDKPELNAEMYVLFVPYVDKYYNCWGADVPGIQYPAPRQIGFGYVTGAAGTDPLGAYYGDSEPTYIWANTGSSVLGFTTSPGDWGCTNPDNTADYFVLNRDYFLSAKPGWTRYTYPHPLRAAEIAPNAPTNVRIR